MDRKTGGSRDGKGLVGSSIPRSPGSSPWEPPVISTIAAKGEGVADLVGALDRHFELWSANGKLEERRRQRMVVRAKDVIDRAVRRWIWSDGQKEELDAMLREVKGGVKSPYEAAASVIARLQESEAYERR